MLMFGFYRSFTENVSIRGFVTAVSTNHQGRLECPACIDCLKGTGPEGPGPPTGAAALAGCAFGIPYRAPWNLLADPRQPKHYNLFNTTWHPSSERHRGRKSRRALSFSLPACLLFINFLSSKWTQLIYLELELNKSIYK